ncbi:MAG: flavodoxin family protein [Candidatus Omnitrophota bacterium]
MKILGISGSPRTGGNTDILLERALLGARESNAETEKIILNNLKIYPLHEEEYENVTEDGLSVISDDMRIIFQKIDEADALILSAPIFFGSLPCQVKTMIDRFQCVWLSKNVLNKTMFIKKKIGAFISVEASEREDFFNNAKSIVRHFFAVINVEYKGEVFCPGVGKKADILKHPIFLDKAYDVGRLLAEGK